MKISERMQNSVQKEHIPTVSGEDFWNPTLDLSPGTRSLPPYAPLFSPPTIRGAQAPTLEVGALEKSSAQALSYLET